VAARYSQLSANFRSVGLQILMLASIPAVLSKERSGSVLAVCELECPFCKCCCFRPFF
jgi:hypothetical protein